jgi:hypothetical protein
VESVHGRLEAGPFKTYPNVEAVGHPCRTTPGCRNSPPTPLPARRREVLNEQNVHALRAVVGVGGCAAVLANHDACAGGMMASCRIMMTGVSQRSGMIAMRER